MEWLTAIVTSGNIPPISQFLVPGSKESHELPQVEEIMNINVDPKGKGKGKAVDKGKGKLLGESSISGIFPTELEGMCDQTKYHFPELMFSYFRQ